ncbi:MAG: hypothetical protein LC730_04875, partial [Acidobacteria bacterium]|nr:hypothetical protein [Acidobacteriota bacterium]
IQDLFAGTGLSGAHYAIIEQGRIGQILSAKPADRRNLIEEAAGISKFRTRQRAAESRLESAKSNLSRISDIVSEIDKQANSLRRQASKTRRYLVLQDEYRLLLRQVFAAEGSRLSQLIDRLKSSLAEATDRETDLAEKVNLQEEAVRSATVAARQAEEDLTDIRRRHSEAALERDRDAREHRYQSEQIINLTNRSSSLEGEIAALEQRLGLVIGERERLEKEDQKESSEADASRQLLVQAEAAYAGKIAVVRQLEDHLEAAREDLIRHTAAVERFDEVKRGLQANIDRLTERKIGLEKEAERAEQTLAENLASARRLDSEKSDETKKHLALGSEKQQLAQAVLTARENLQRSEEQLRTIENEYSRSRHRLDTLEELEEKKAVYTVPVQKLFAEQDEIGVTFFGVLADYLKVDEPSERAIESLFGNMLEAVVVESTADASKTAEYIRRSSAGRAAVLIAPQAALGEPVQIALIAGRTVGESLHGGSQFGEILARAFPRELRALVVDGFEPNAAETETAVNFDGEVLAGGSLLVAGRVSTDETNSSLLAFKRELASLGS